MYDLIKDTAITIPVFVHDASGDAVTGLTDGSFTKTLSKNGGAKSAMTVTITEDADGWYLLPLSAAHVDTLGVLSVTLTNAGAKQVNLQWRVVNASGLGGGGADIVQVTVTDSVASSAIADAQAWVTSDAAGLVVVDGYLTTDASGQATFLLDEGSTYYFWLSKSGARSISGESFVASSSGNAFSTTVAVAGSGVGVTNLVNMALINIGEDTILSITDTNSEAARKANAIYDNERRSVLMEHNWSSAKKLASLAKTASTPLWGFTSEYQLPSDFLRISLRQDADSSFAIYGDKFYTNQDSANIEYICDLEDTTLMSQLLREALAAKLSSVLAMAITNSSEKKRLFDDRYQSLVEKAMWEDSGSDSPHATGGDLIMDDGISGVDPTF